MFSGGSSGYWKVNCTRLAGIADGQIAKEQRIDEAEDGGVGADGERQRGDRDRGEQWRADERARGVANIADEVFQPGQPALIAALLHRLRDAARLQPRLSQRLVVRQAAPLQLVGEHFHMEPELLFHVGVFRRLAERAPEPPQPCANRGHHCGSLSRACMMATVRCHSRFSASSSFRPAVVRS